MNQQREGPLAVNAEISDGAVRLLHDYTGRGPTRSRTTIHDDTVMIMIGDTLTKGERKLIENGNAERVLQLRHDFQMAMRDDLIELVEGATERKVVAFMSQNHIDPDLAIEVFVLEPTAD
ncbi:MAG TPA: Na-translocating system protein MpsC family protein [Thermoleophilaceae bacterium]|nr:Na-translocating system protein MpsC family protein [Thermoleophilaceae bacterium]